MNEANSLKRHQYLSLRRSPTASMHNLSGMWDNILCDIFILFRFDKMEVNSFQILLVDVTLYL